jgi:predicted ATPase
MNHQRKSREAKGLPASEGFTQISVCGYKSIARRQSIEIRPLTILAGANSSGKSSIVQPLLLLKQTLEASFDPGPLLLDGPNVRFTSGDQFLSRLGKGCCQDLLEIEMRIGSHRKSRVLYKWNRERGLDFEEMTSGTDESALTLRPNMTEAEILSTVPHFRDVATHFQTQEEEHRKWQVVRERCFLGVELRQEDGKRTGTSFKASPAGGTVEVLQELIHVPGLRGNPLRTYPVTAVGPTFPGTFESYVASVIAHWQTDKDTHALEAVNRALGGLRLTWKVSAEPVTHTQVQLEVGRLPHAKRGGAHDLVSIADVGFGVSQTLPVIVALLVAQPGQAVYLEQPEIHLHPRAQTRMAELLSEAALRGVRVIAETHSSLLLRAIQTLVAKGKISPDLVKLHWFTRQEDGTTEVNSADLDEWGAFGDWPEDFDETAIATERDYLDAAEVRSQAK